MEKSSLALKKMSYSPERVQTCPSHPNLYKLYGFTYCANVRIYVICSPVGYCSDSTIQNKMVFTRLSWVS